MSGIAAPPPWVLGLKLKPGPWRVLVGLWTYATYGVETDQVIGPSREHLAGRIGLTDHSTIRGHLRTLRALGLVADEPCQRWGPHGLRLVWSPPSDRAKCPGLTGASTPPPGPTAPGQVPRPPGQPPRSDRGNHPAKPGQPPRQTGATTPPDLVVTLRDPGEDLRARNPNPHLAPDLLARHRAISEAGAPTRAVSPLEPAYSTAIAQAGWYPELHACDHPSGGSRWAHACADVVRDLGLTPEQVVAILGRWSAAAADLSPSERARQLPPRREIWWGKHRKWIEAQLRVVDRVPDDRVSTARRLPPLPDRSEPVDPAELERLERAVAAMDPALRLVETGARS